MGVKFHGVSRPWKGVENIVAEASESLQLIISNELQSVGAAHRALEEFLKARDVPPNVVFSAILAFEEIVTNVIKYSFQDEREHDIQADLRVGPGELVLRVTDDGLAFDPLGAPPPERKKAFEERPVGGLGIHLVRNLAQRIEYRRVDKKNVLTMFFPLDATT